MIDDAWQEYLEAVNGMQRLPSALRARQTELEASCAVAIGAAEREHEVARRRAGEVRDVADSAETAARGRLEALGMALPPVAGTAAGASAGSVTELTRELRRLQGVFDDEFVAFESARRSATRRAAADAAEAAAAARLRAQEEEERRLAEEARTRRQRTLLVVAGLVLVVVLVAILLLVL